MKARYLVAAGAASLLFSTPALATTFVDDWEDTDYNGSPGYVVLANYSDWTTTAGSGIEVQYDGVAGQAHSGTQLVELDSHVNSAMTYDFGLDAGWHTLTFWYSDRINTAADTNGIDVLLNGTSIYSVAGGAGGGATNWIQHSHTFNANLGDDLTFAALGTSDSLGGYIDDLELSAAVPEPGTWLMLLLGFGLVGGAVRASRKREAGPRVRYAL